MCDNERVQDLCEAAAARAAAMKDHGSSSSLDTSAGRACKYLFCNFVMHAAAPLAAAFSGIHPETFVWKVLEFLWILAGLLVSRWSVDPGLTPLQVGKNSELDDLQALT